MKIGEKGDHILLPVALISNLGISFVRKFQRVPVNYREMLIRLRRGRRLVKHKLGLCSKVNSCNQAEVGVQY